MKLRDKVCHRLNPLHVYCRLREYRVPYSKEIARGYGYLMESAKRKSKWTKRLKK